MVATTEQYKSIKITVQIVRWSSILFISGKKRRPRHTLLSAENFINNTLVRTSVTMVSVHLKALCIKKFCH